MQTHWPKEEEMMMQQQLILQPRDVGVQKDLWALLKQLKKTTAFCSHEPLNSVVIQQIQLISFFFDRYNSTNKYNND